MGVKLQSSSGGSVEIAAPVTASNYTLTAPAANGTILNDASSLAAANLTGDVAAARITSALNASGAAPVYACRAWVNFNGTGTVAIRASGNVSSITDNGTGSYTVNFTTAMPDTSYAFIGQCNSAAANSGEVVFKNTSGTNTASAVSLLTGVPGTYGSTSMVLVDQSETYVAIFR